MHLRSDVHQYSPVSRWPRARDVVITNNQIQCRLAIDRAYSLEGAYQKDPHVQFVNCKSDQDLCTFVRAWGPLELDLEEQESGSCERPVKQYWAAQAKLRAAKSLVEACKSGHGTREALLTFYDAEAMCADAGNVRYPIDPRYLHGKDLRYDFGRFLGAWGFAPNDLTQWLFESSAESFRSGLAFATELALGTHQIEHIEVVTHTRRMQVVPVRELRSLWAGLRWMLWFDEWNVRSPQYCLECRTLFRAFDARRRKYCDSGNCGHRVANRKYARKRRKHLGRGRH
jgi:hypothetical protein